MTDFYRPVSLRQKALFLAAAAVLVGWIIARLEISLLVQLALVGLSIAVGWGLFWLSSRPFFAQLEGLAGILRRGADYRDLPASLPGGGDRNLAQVSQALHDLLAYTAQREVALIDAQNELQLRVSEVAVSNAELNTVLRRLNAAQEHMESSERMASLGSLVAGVAHEINTPVGIGVTAASSMQSLVEAVEKKYQRGELGHTELCKFFDSAQQYGSLLMSNLTRAAELVSSFKRVAVNQTADQLSEFDLRAYVDEVWRSLSPQLKGTSLSYVIESDDNMVVRGYAGAISQILTNLVMNSLMHAYSPGSAGTLTLSLRRNGDMITMRYCDDGDGVEPEHLECVCEPFFTTKRGNGGSGLGMYIVYNLAKQRLQGDIALHSEPGKGFCVNLTFPADLGRDEQNIENSRDVFE